jgi:hypothetical protein
MSKVSKLLLPGLVGLGLLAAANAPRAANSPAGIVTIGDVNCFRIRVPDGNTSAQQRVDHVQDVSAKYLGGGPLRFRTRAVGQRRHIDLNDEFLLAVTPADAGATGYKTAAALAPVWQRALERAFRLTRARPATSSDTAPK